MPVVRPDWAGGESVKPTPPKRTAPRPTTPGGNTFGYKPKPSSPGGGTFASNPIQYYQPAPINYANPPATYSQAPATNYVPYTPPYQGSVGGGEWGGSVGGGGGDWGGSTGGGGGMPSVPAAPPPPPPPTVGGRLWYSKLSAAEKKAEDEKWLRGDSDYTDQIGQYEKALQDYKGRIGKRITQYGEDEKLARGNTEKNRDYSMNSLGEDFGARGLSYSGMFKTESDRNLERFTEALAGILKAKDRNVSDANNELADYSSENQIGRGNARRSALVRMAQNQNLIDTSALL